MEDEQYQSEIPLRSFVEFITELTENNPGCSKEDLASAAAAKFGLAKKRSVYSGKDFSVRFSTASGKSFSNVVISLSTLKKYDQLPFIVCIVRPTGAELLLANTTFLKKVSHSSQQLRGADKP